MKYFIRLSIVLSFLVSSCIFDSKKEKTPEDKPPITVPAEPIDTNKTTPFGMKKRPPVLPPIDTIALQ